ncbi:MAG TPA: sulfite exporter TauE/SafE family protein [Gammaproteobacteria bacterium]|nr:sulfite exporter TauE/SafE family protein [Gammaproteobacteria bacterium]
MEAAFVIAGLVVGFAVGLTGVGGGALMTPLLHLGFGIPLPAAVGTDLLYAAITKGSGAAVHARNGVVDWRVVRLLGTGSLPAAVVTVLALRWLALDGRVFAEVISVALSGALFLTAAFMLLRRRLLDWARGARGVDGLRTWVRLHRDGLTLVAGVVIGIMVTLTSVGAGVLGTTAILLLYPRLTAVGVVGTELAHAVPLTLVAGLGHLSLGTVDFALLGSLLVGSIPGVWAGSRLGARVSDRLLRPVIASILVLIGVRLVMAVT